MITIKLIDARRGLYLKCRELFGDEKIAENIYNYLCEGIEECEECEPERKTGKWIPCSERLPKKTGYYICTCHDGACYRTSTLKWSTGWILTGARSYWKVMAWMPLPEPYGGGQE